MALLNYSQFANLHKHNTPQENVAAFVKYTQTANPGAYNPPAAPAAAPPGPNPYLDPAVAAGVNAYMGVPGQYNPQLTTAAATTRASLAGYSDTPVTSDAVSSTPTAMQVGMNPDGTPIMQTPDAITQYSFHVGPDGQLYRQLASSGAHSAAARGVVSGSEIGNAYDTGHQALDTAKQGIETSGLTQQGTLAQGAAGAQTTATGQVGTGLANWNQNQSTLAQNSAPAPVTAPAPFVPKISYKQFVQKHGGKSTTPLAAAWKATYGNKNWITPK